MPLASITVQLTDAIAPHGVLVVALVMAVDAVLPAGGEVTMLFAGALASGALAHHTTLLGMPISDGLDAYVVLSLAGTLGYVAGSAAGRLLGRRADPCSSPATGAGCTSGRSAWRAPSAGFRASAPARSSSAG